MTDDLTRAREWLPQFNHDSDLYANDSPENVAASLAAQFAAEGRAEALASVLGDTALRLIERDPHQYSTRPCPTCATISIVINRSFGCVAKAEKGSAK